MVGRSTLQGARRLAARTAGRAALRVAQSTPGGLAARFACAHARWLLPVVRIADTPGALVFRHPAPEARGHLVIVPRAAVRDLCALVATGRVDRLVAMIEAARVAPLVPDDGERVLVVNTGKRQRVGQLHAPVLPLAAVSAGSSTGSTARVDLGSPADMRSALHGVVQALQRCDPTVAGSLIVRGFDRGSSVELSTRVAPRRGTR